MKSLTKDFFKTTIIAALALVFAITLSVVNADWTAAPSNPPANNTPAPLNVGTIDQVKNAGLSLNSLLVTGGIRITSGSPAVGKVLTSDVSGNATWQALTGTGGAASIFGPLPVTFVNSSNAASGISSTFSLADAGNYLILIDTNSYCSNSAAGSTINFKIDGTLINTRSCGVASSYPGIITDYDFTAGSHTISYVGNNAGSGISSVGGGAIGSGTPDAHVYLIKKGAVGSETVNTVASGAVTGGFVSSQIIYDIGPAKNLCASVWGTGSCVVDAALLSRTGISSYSGVCSTGNTAWPGTIGINFCLKN